MRAVSHSLPFSCESSVAMTKTIHILEVGGYLYKRGRYISGRCSAACITLRAIHITLPSDVTLRRVAVFKLELPSKFVCQDNH